MLLDWLLVRIVHDHSLPDVCACCMLTIHTLPVLAVQPAAHRNVQARVCVAFTQPANALERSTATP